jgi:hypothetical protein
MCLVVVKPFGNYMRGDLISDPEEITKILRGEQKKFVVKINPSSGGGGKV